MIPFIITIISITMSPVQEIIYEPPHFLYMEVASEDSTSYETMYGTFHLNDDKRVRKNNPFTSEDLLFVDKLDSTLNTLPEDRRNILIYIHGMWAHRNFFQEEVLTRIRQDALNEGSSPYGVVISVIWHSGMNYFDNSQHALAVGKHYSQMIEKIINLDISAVSVMCHSMGNRVFQGVLANLESKDYENPPFERALMIAADLEVNIFDEGQPLHHIDKYVKHPIIYVHNNDRSLGMSRALNENDRLGLNADNETLSTNKAIQIIDVSTVDDNEGFGPSLSNHRYFYTSPTVRKDLYYSLHDVPNPQRKDLDDPRRQKLVKQ